MLNIGFVLTIIKKIIFVVALAQLCTKQAYFILRIRFLIFHSFEALHSYTLHFPITRDQAWCLSLGKWCKNMETGTWFGVVKRVLSQKTSLSICQALHVLALAKITDTRAQDEVPQEGDWAQS